MKVYPLFILEGVRTCVGIYSTRENAESEISDSEIYSIIEVSLDGVIDPRKFIWKMK